MLGRTGLSAIAVAVLMAGARYNPVTLFAAGEQGALYDYSDLSSMWQDSAGTTPAVVGQPVGKVLDKSGRGNHATQSVGASRPNLQQDASGKYYLDYDGIDDFLTSTIDLSASDSVSVWVAARKASDATIGTLVELTTNSSSAAGSFAIFAPGSGGAAGYLGRSRGTAAASATSATSYAAPNSALLYLSADISSDTCILSVSGAAVSSATDQGTGNYANSTLYNGRRGGATLPYIGRQYSLIVRGALTDALTAAKVASYLTRKSGIS